jgi:hypothetical protein
MALDMQLVELGHDQSLLHKVTRMAHPACVMLCPTCKLEVHLDLPGHF